MEQLNGNEPFTLHGSDTSIMLQDFWRWAYSDLLNNTHRGVLAEFLVHSARCLLYTSDAADDLLCGDLGGRRNIKKKNQQKKKK